MLKYASRVRQLATEAMSFAGFFSSTDVLVPVPGHSAVSWAAEFLAAALIREGLGRSVWLGLRRARAVRKSATAPRGERPTMDSHYESFCVERPTISAERILLIDDVVTKGSTLLAAANRLHEVFPCSQIRAFALVRTRGLIDGIPQLLDPCMGEISWQSGETRRVP
jgi:predicted amidophosphoribosyltransferase